MKAITCRNPKGSIVSVTETLVLPRRKKTVHETAHLCPAACDYDLDDEYESRRQQDRGQDVLSTPHSTPPTSSDYLTRHLYEELA